MKTAVSTTVMKECDLATAARTDGDTRELMRRAGEAIANHALSRRETYRVGIVCGVGGNGGDGYAAATYLYDAGVYCRLCSVIDRYSADGEYFWHECQKRNIPCELVTESTDLSDCDTVIDCIFGVGFHGTPSGAAAVAIEKINSSGAYVISADINSGLGGNSGLGSVAVRSDLTVAIGSYKYGHVLGMAKDCIGSLVLEPIGIGITDNHTVWADEADFADVFPERKHYSHKGTYGTAAILGGCREYSGAVKLANIASSALRAGAGLSRLIVPSSIADAVMPHLLESTLLPLPDRDGHALFLPEAIDSSLRGASSLAVGMGWGKSEDNIKILRHILKNYSLPLVIDADGINAVAEHGIADVIMGTECRVILTPHPAEFSRLTGLSVSEILSDPIAHAEAFAAKHRLIVLLKGTATVVTDGHRTILVSRGSPGMAKGGSGDVLSGVLSGMLAHAPATVDTVATAAFICGVAGELAAAEVGAVSVLASDTVRHIPSAVKMIVSAKTAARE